jgi:hypothetical protein
MICPDCRSPQTRKLSTHTDLGYSRFCCRHCRRTFNERTGTPFHRRAFQVQNNRNAFRCQAITVSGLTILSAERHSARQRAGSAGALSTTIWADAAGPREQSGRWASFRSHSMRLLASTVLLHCPVSLRFDLATRYCICRPNPRSNRALNGNNSGMIPAPEQAISQLDRLFNRIQCRRLLQR